MMMKLYQKWVSVLGMLFFLVVVLECCVFGVRAQEGDRYPETDWFRDAKLGAFMHFLPGNAEQFARVEQFDVNALADQLTEMGAGYFVITLQQNSGYINSPNGTYDRYTGYKAGEKCSTRDLPLDLYNALKPRGIKLMLYIPGQVPNRDARAQGAFGLKQGAADQAIDVVFARKWAEVIKEWSDRYGDKVAGWWFDGCYQWVNFDDSIAEIYAAAVKHGNPDAIVAFNPGVKVPVVRASLFENYTAGELNDPLEQVPAGRWLGGAQWHALTYMGSSWGSRNVRYSDEQWIGWVRRVAQNEGVVTLDMGPNFDPQVAPVGTFAPEQVAQFKAIRAALNPEQKVRVALITQPHGYDEANFHKLLDSFEGITWREYRNPDAHKLFLAEHAGEYDVMVFYDMCPEISDVEKEALVGLVKNGKSVMVLHHGFGTFNQWAEFGRIAGSKYLLSPQTIDGKEYGYSSYREDVDIPIRVADGSHFITQGVDDFTINDEVYGNMWQSADVHPLLTSDQKECSPNVLYTHQYGKARVVGLTLAHGKGAFQNPDYARAFQRALLWLGYRDGAESGPVVLAYVTSWSRVVPDPTVVTHINYAFGHVTKTFDGVRIDNEDRLRMLVDLKKKNPKLKVLLSIGGWGSGNFSEMAASESNRKAFAGDCQRVVRDFDLDGIDIDWEFPTSGAANISASPDDTANYTRMMREIRSAIGPEKLLTLASQAGGGYVDFKALEPVIDFVNIMTYDMGNPPKHNAPLYRSEHVGWISAEEGVNKHIAAGIPAAKLVLGLPFYGHGRDGVGGFIDYRQILRLGDEYTRNWDDEAKVPYLTNKDGNFVCSYDDARSVGIKCEFLRQRGLLGAMYWEYGGDDGEGTLRRAVYNALYPKLAK